MVKLTTMSEKEITRLHMMVQLEKADNARKGSQANGNQHSAGVTALVKTKNKNIPLCNNKLQNQNT